MPRIAFVLALMGCSGGAEGPDNPDDPGNPSVDLSNPVVEALPGPITHNPRFSEDDSSILGKIMVDRDVADIVRIGNDGEAVQSFEGFGASDSNRAWSPVERGGYVYMPKHDGIVRVPSAGGLPETLVEDDYETEITVDESYGLDVSPDARTILFKRRFNLVTFDLETEEEVAVPGIGGRQPRFDPTGTRVVYSAVDLTLADMSDGSVITIDEGNSSSGDFMPDGRIVWCGEGGLHVSTEEPPGTWTKQLVLPYDNADCRYVNVAPDGKSILISGFDADDADPQLITFE